MSLDCVALIVPATNVTSLAVFGPIMTSPARPDSKDMCLVVKAAAVVDPDVRVKVVLMFDFSLSMITLEVDPKPDIVISLTVAEPDVFKTVIVDSLSVCASKKENVGELNV